MVHQWAFLYSPAAGQPSQCRRRNEGWCGFVWVFSHFAAQWSVAFTCLPISQFQLYEQRGWHVNDRVTWFRPHVSHNSSRRLVKTSKQEVGRALSDFYVSFWGLDSKKKNRLHAVSLSRFQRTSFFEGDARMLLLQTYPDLCWNVLEKSQCLLNLRCFTTNDL